MCVCLRVCYVCYVCANACVPVPACAYACAYVARNKIREIGGRAPRRMRTCACVCTGFSALLRVPTVLHICLHVESGGTCARITHTHSHTHSPTLTRSLTHTHTHSLTHSRSIRVFSWRKGTPLCVLIRHKGAVRCLATANVPGMGWLLLAGGDDAHVSVWVVYNLPATGCVA